MPRTEGGAEVMKTGSPGCKKDSEQLLTVRELRALTPKARELKWPLDIRSLSSEH